MGDNHDHKKRKVDCDSFQEEAKKGNATLCIRYDDGKSQKFVENHMSSIIGKSGSIQFSHVKAFSYGCDSNADCKMLTIASLTHSKLLSRTSVDPIRMPVLDRIGTAYSHYTGDDKVLCVTVDPCRYIAYKKKVYYVAHKKLDEGPGMYILNTKEVVDKISNTLTAICAAEKSIWTHARASVVDMVSIKPKEPHHTHNDIRVSDEGVE